MSLQTFTDAYIECALWSSIVGEEEDSEPLDANHSADDIAPETLARIEEDCEDFYDAQSELWSSVDMDDSQAGHDFWLTRNRHGAGFWDRGLGAVGDQLTEAAKVYGSVDLYVGDDGKIYS